MERQWRVGLRASLAVFLIILATLAVARPAGAQGRLRGPYLDIVWDYRDGNHQEAIDAIAAWPIDGIRERVFKDFDTGVALAIGGGRRKATETQRFAMVKIWAALTPVAALMHIEAGYQLLEKKQDKAGIQHLLLARLMVDWDRWPFILDYVPNEGKELAYKKLRRDVYLAIAWILQSAIEEATLDEHLELARKNMPEEAEIWLASGSAQELNADPAVLKRQKTSPDSLVPNDTQRLRMRERFLEKAEEYHREAIKRDPALAEAHVRLGRVLELRGKLADARAELEAARKLEAPREMSYLATLFLAGIVEEASKSAPAFDLYAELVEKWPECQSGHLGLSRAHSARGDWPAALEALKPLRKEQQDRACFDAWWVYWSGQTWRLKDLLEDLRDRVVS